MARPILVLNCGRYYQPGYFEHHWPKLLERCEIKLTDLSEGPELAEVLADASVMIARRDYVGRPSLAAAKQLRGVVTGGVGVEKVDVAAATELGIAVANSPGNSVTVAESTILLMLALGKQMLSWIENGQTGTAPTSSMHGLELYRKTIGLVGYGRIGRWVARLCNAFGMKVIVYDPYVTTDGNAELVSLEEVMQQSDFVSLHPVLTDETFHMINAERLAMMKPTAFLINTSRGGVIDELALIDALEMKQLAGAGLDVFEKEPPALDNPLLHMPNVIGTPHGLSHTEESFDRCCEYTQDNVIAMLDGKLPPYLVNTTVKWRALAAV